MAVAVAVAVSAGAVHQGLQLQEGETPFREEGDPQGPLVPTRV